MKLKIFYSWQSDLPNKTNRQFIYNCLEKALNEIYKSNKSISEYTIESDSRGESGTPELASSLFAKIDQCDIFVADISIINATVPSRKVCNPNVLIELGYASAKIGWERILCVYNTDFGKIEDLPFDIRHRKPLIYSSDSKLLSRVFITQIQSIIDNYINSKKYFISIKKELDLGLQGILIDLSKILYFEDGAKKYAYNVILHLTEDEIRNEISGKKILGFQLFKNTLPHLQEFTDFFNNQVYLNFLNEVEKNTLAKIILQFKDLQNLFENFDMYDTSEKADSYAVINGEQINEENPKSSYILVEKIGTEKGVVLDSGTFKKSQLNYLTSYYRIKPNLVGIFVGKIHELSFEINEWIRVTGDYFILNTRLLETSE